jgi:hypothetical protein
MVDSYNSNASYRWMLSLKPLIASAASTSSSSRSSLDINKLTWQKISKKGMYPSPRSGAAMVVYKNKAILFGGVTDIEGARHSIISTFYNDMYAFDMERRYESFRSLMILLT